MKYPLQNKNRSLILAVFLILGMGTVWADNNPQRSIPTGAINGVFSVSATQKVFFSQGNLQYIGSATVPYWKFADHQWDYLGTTTNQNTSNQNVDRDLFGWGTSGYNHGANCYQPWITSTSNSDYYAYGSNTYNLYDQTGQADWGYNAIANGGNTENSGWRTLTRDEWVYLFNTRTTASGIRYAKAQVNNVNGVILLPDDWQTSYYSLNSTNNGAASFSSNVITASLWNILEQFGAVFLPAAGYRNGTSIIDVGSGGNYWSASYNTDIYAYYVCFFYGNLYASYNFGRYIGQSVRLARLAENCSFGINATPSPAEGGAVSGTGTYMAGAECTLTATPSAGYAFGCWTEEGVVVSVDAAYTFIALRDRNLVANFVFNSSFSVSGSQQVYFSPGNLQYRASTNTWCFAKNQWDYVGADNSNIAETYSGLIDLFGWGTSGYNHGANCYQPWSTSESSSDYYAYGNDTYNLYDQTGQADWGYNAIYNGGNKENSGWRTLINDEWIYLFDTRATVSGIRYAKATVNNVNGVILLPDDWSTDYYTLNSTNTYNASFSTNIITATQWANLEQHGAVFLPAAGYRSGTSVYDVGSNGNYWSASYDNSNSAYRVNFDDGNLTAGYTSNVRLCGRSVRLVCPVENCSFTINATPSPAEGGVVSGADAYMAGAECTLTATPSAGYVFGCWTENGAVVSLDASYTIKVLWDRNLVANFVAVGNIVFTDANVKAVCVDNWDVNGDGELSYAEAAKVTDLGDVFKNNTSIHSFNELQHFVFLPSIGSQAFYGCTELTQVTIPARVAYIGDQAFWNCPALQTVFYNAVSCNFMQSTYNSNTYSVFSSNSSGGASALTRVVIGNSVTCIPDYAFKGSSDIYQRLVIPASVTRIGNYAFDGCSSIPMMLIQGNGLLTIGDYAFRNCSALANALNLPNSVTTVGQYAFYGCTLLPTLTIGEGVTTIGAYAFANCSGFHGDLVVPNSVNSIGQYAFSQCSGFNGTLNLPINELFTIIQEGTFYRCSNLTGILTIPANITEIASNAFYSCSGFTGNLVFPNSVTTLGSSAFQNCSGFNGSLVLGSGVANINLYTFAGCSGFTESLIIGRAVNSIGDYAFRNCSGFTSLIAENPAPITATSSSFIGMTYTIPVHVPYGLINNYQNATGWKLFTNYKNQFTFEQLDNANWSDAMNWYTFELPGPDDVVCVNSNCNLDVDANVLRVYVLNLNDVFTVNSGQTLGVNYGVGILQGSQLVLEEGSQLINNLPGVQGTIQLNLGGKGRDGDGWFTIAAPIYGGMPVNAVTLGNYDLYAYDEPAHYWRNQKVTENAITRLNLGQGYLYANQSVTLLSLSGELNPSNAQFSVPVTYQGSPLAGYTLLGNPYTNNLNISDVKLNGTPLTTYYKIHGGGSLVAYSIADPIHPGEGFLVMAPEGGTITFEPSVGQNRESDEPVNKGDLEPMRGFRLPAHAFMFDVNAFEGESQAVTITTTVNNTEGGTVSGGGSYTVGSTCTLTATPNENYSFVNWTLNGTPVSSNATYSFSVMGAGTYMANFEQTTFTQATALTNGWNWWSSYIELNGIDGLTLLENSLGNNGLVVKSRENGFVESYDNNGSPLWYGTLNAINNEQMYMIRTNADCAALLTGQPASPANHPVTINPGWNWIGYPNKQALSVETAFSGFTPAANDVVKGRYHYTTYYNENGNSLWYGTLNSFEPGQGYMYQSNANGVKTLTFSGSKGEDVQANIAMDGNIFKPNTEAFANTMTVTAVVETEGIELRSDNYELAAFVGDECRGSVKLMFVAPLNRYVAFLTVFGEPDDEILFRLTDGNGTTTAAERCAFVTDGTLGSLTQPRVLHFGNLGVEDDEVSSVSVYPNPVEKGQLFRITLPASFGNATVEIIDVMGRVVLTRRDARHCVSTPDTPGVYTVRVIGEQGQTWHGKIIVK